MYCETLVYLILWSTTTRRSGVFRNGWKSQSNNIREINKKTLSFTTTVPSTISRSSVILSASRAKRQVQVPIPFKRKLVHHVHYVPRHHGTRTRFSTSTTYNSKKKNPSFPQRVKQAISERPVEYATIPIVAAMVGISTNYMGVQMLFYPIEYMGTSHRRYPDCPYGIFGWQGVVPARTIKMANRLVDIVTRDLLSLKEAFSNLCPTTLAQHLHDPIVEAIRKDCGWYWSLVLKPFLPILLPRILTELQEDIESILDLPNLVLQSFVRDKVILVELFQKVGRVELDFLVTSGFGFGFLLGLGQMGLWTLMPRPWTLPVAGAVVGYVTNWIAIKLLFEPADPINIGPFVLQGLFESRQPEVSDEFGHFMQTRVLTSAQLLSALANENEQELYNFLRRQLPPPIPKHIVQAAVEAIRNVAANPQEYPELHSYITQKLDIEKTLASRLKVLSPKNFEDLLHPVFQEDEIILIVVGGILGALAGMVQTRLGWGGVRAQKKAIATLLGAMASSGGFFWIQSKGINLDFGERKEPELPMSMSNGTNNLPKMNIRRSNSILRQKNE